MGAVSTWVQGSTRHCDSKVRRSLALLQPDNPSKDPPHPESSRVSPLHKAVWTDRLVKRIGQTLGMDHLPDRERSFSWVDRWPGQSVVVTHMVSVHHRLAAPEEQSATSLDLHGQTHHRCVRGWQPQDTLVAD